MGMCNCSTCRPGWWSFPLAHSHMESTALVSEQVLAQIFKPHAYHLNLVLSCHLGLFQDNILAPCSLQINSYPQLLDLLRFTPVRLLGQRDSSIKPTLVVHSLLPHPSHPTPAFSSPSILLPQDGELITCLVPSARSDLCGWVKNSLSWDQNCLMSNQSMGRAPMATPIHRAFRSKGQSKQLVTTVLMDRILLCTAHLTHKHENSLIQQVFISGNATRVVFSPQCKAQCFSSRSHKNFLSNPPCPHIDFIAFLLAWGRNENGWW